MQSLIVPLALITSAAFAQPAIPTAGLREEMRIVSNDASINTSLTPIAPASIVLRDGRILTLHRMESVVRVFDANGRFVRMLGRAGDGPGEFRMPLAMGTVGDSIWVFNSRPAAYEIFGPDLKPIARMRLPVRGVNIPQFGLSPQRTTIAVAGFGDTAVAGVYGDSGLVRPINFKFKQREHRFQVTNAAPLGGRPGPRSIASPLQAQDEILMSRDGRDVVVIEPGETWGGTPGQLRVRRVSLTTGQLSAPVTISLPARRIPAGERDSIIAAFARSQPEIESQIKSLARLPDYYPPFMINYVQPMGDGLVWLREYARPNDRVVIDVAGRALMRITLPQTLVVFAATRTQVWGFLRDANDLPIIVRYRIVAQ